MNLGHFEFTLMMPFRVGVNDPDAHSSCASIGQFLGRNGPGWKQKAADATLLDEQAKHARYQEYVYFHPFMQRLLYTCRDMTEYVREDVARVIVKSGKRDELASIMFDVTTCQLAVFDPDLVVLTLGLKLPKDQGISVAAAQDTLDAVRRAYAPYFGGNATDGRYAGHCANSVEVTFAGFPPTTVTSHYADFESQWALVASAATVPTSVGTPLPLAAHWRALLAPLHVLGYPVYAPNPAPYPLISLGDDRAFVMAFVGVPEPRAYCETHRGDVIRFGLIDDSGDGPLPYAKPSLDDFEKNHCYDRFWYRGGAVDSGMKPNRIMLTPYSFVYLGDSRDKRFFMDEGNGAIAHFRNAYRKLVLVALVQRSMLLNASWRLSCLAEDSKNDDKLGERVAGFYEAFLGFTQRFWFFEVSPQQQGQELFNRLQTHMQTKELYEEVRQELKDTVESENLKYSQRAAEYGARLMRVATWLGGLGVVAGLLGMNIFKTEKADELTLLGLKIDQFPLLSWTFPEPHVFWVNVIWIALSVVVVGGIAWLLTRNASTRQTASARK